MALAVSLDRRRFEVLHGGQQAGFTEEMHAHDFEVRIMVLGDEITLIGDGKSETFRAGQCCKMPADCQHATSVGLEGVAYTVGKAYRRAATN